jgi:hypothetical protein
VEEEAPGIAVAEEAARPRSGGFLARLFATPAPAPGATPVAPAPVAAPIASVVTQAPAGPAYQGVATGVTGVTCPPQAPNLERVVVTGGTALVCTQGDGTLAGWQHPVIAPTRAAQRAAAAVPISPMTRMPAAPARVAPPMVVAPVVTVAAPVLRSLPKPPKGWVAAWDDDRLNPMRGIGTPEGEAAQDRVWTRTVPMEEVIQPAAPAVTVSTMSQSGEGIMVQVGSFGDPANAQRSQDRIGALGLPVALSRHKSLQVVMAGPFASAEAAAQALTALRAAGFADAFVR